MPRHPPRHPPSRPAAAAPREQRPRAGSSTGATRRWAQADRAVPPCSPRHPPGRVRPGAARASNSHAREHACTAPPTEPPQARQPRAGDAVSVLSAPGNVPVLVVLPAGPRQARRSRGRRRGGHTHRRVASRRPGAHGAIRWAVRAPAAQGTQRPGRHRPRGAPLPRAPHAGRPGRHRPPGDSPTRTRPRAPRDSAAPRAGRSGRRPRATRLPRAQVCRVVRMGCWFRGGHWCTPLTLRRPRRGVGETRRDPA